MQSIKEAMGAVVASVLKEEGFSSVESRALEYLSVALLNYSVYTAARMKKQAEMSRRTSPTLVDGSIILQEIASHTDQVTQKETERNSQYKTPIYAGISFSDLLTKSSKIQNTPLISTEEDTPSFDDSEVMSEACTQVEYPQNYYEFFPKFPPAHTFKNSSIKRKITDDRAQKARLRNEQTKKIVENLFTIMMKSGKTSKYANYLL